MIVRSSWRSSELLRYVAIGVTYKLNHTTQNFVAALLDRHRVLLSGWLLCPLQVSVEVCDANCEKVEIPETEKGNFKALTDLTGN